MADNVVVLPDTTTTTTSVPAPVFSITATNDEDSELTSIQSNNLVTPDKQNELNEQLAQLLVQQGIVAPTCATLFRQFQTDMARFVNEHIQEVTQAHGKKPQVNTVTETSILTEKVCCVKHYFTII